LFSPSLRHPAEKRTYTIYPSHPPSPLRALNRLPHSSKPSHTTSGSRSRRQQSSEGRIRASRLGNDLQGSLGGLDPSGGLGREGDEREREESDRGDAKEKERRRDEEAKRTLESEVVSDGKAENANDIVS